MKKRFPGTSASVLALCVLFAVAQAVHAQTPPDAYAIMKAADEKAGPKTTHALVKLELVDDKGGISERVVEEWSAENDKGLSSTVIVFHAPASVKGSRFLTVANEGRDDDTWIYLPALKKIRRIAASEGGGSFFGTEFSYDDLGSRELDDYTYKYLGSETVKGYDCHVIESTPKDPKGKQYSKIVSWMVKDPEILLPIRVDLYKDGPKPAKTMSMNELKKIGAFWTVTSLTMKNNENGKATNMIQQNIEFDKPVSSARFTTKFLETGRID